MNRNIRKDPPRLATQKYIGTLLLESDISLVDRARLYRNRKELLSRLEMASVSPHFSQGKSYVHRYRLAVATASFLFFVSMGAAAVLYIQARNDTSSNDNSASVVPAVSTASRGGSRTPSLAALPETPLQTEDSKDVLSTPQEIEPSLPDDDGKSSQLRNRRKSLESTLEAQVRLFTKAQKETATGNFDAALLTLKRLTRSYPSSPLRLEVHELEARCLAGLHRYNQAAQVVTGLIHANITTRKKSQLFRFLGDLQLKQNRCKEAVASYQTALALGLSRVESAAARGGIQKCVSQGL